MKVKLLLGLVLATSLFGCATHDEFFTPPIAIPLQPSADIQNKVFQMDILLDNPDLSDEDKENYLIQQAMNYDMLGLYDLAYVKYLQVLDIEPNKHVYNAIGMYYIMNQQYDIAFEAYDAALAIDADYDYAEFNRGVALYYAERYQLAFEDIERNHNRYPDDPFRILWRYIIQHKLDSEQALSEIQALYNQSEDKNDWGWQLVGMMANLRTPEELLTDIIENTPSNREIAMKLSEFYFYLGKQHQDQGEDLVAVNLYKLSISQNVYEYIEHKYALVELKQLLTKLDKEAEIGSVEQEVNE